MSYATSFMEYEKALALGHKECRACRAKGLPLYPPVLDEVLDGVDTRGEVELGLVDVPIQLITGTKSAGRQRAFSPSFYPLLGGESELAMKWTALCDAHLNEGINEPIKVYEYLHDFYVQEGHKRVSVLRYFEAVTIPAMVTRILPPADGSLTSRIYQEYLDFYALTGINYLWFTETGRFARLQSLMGKAPGEAWTTEELRDFFIFYHRFLSAYDAKSARELLAKRVTPGDALIMLITLCGYSLLRDCTGPELKTTLARLRTELMVVAQIPLPQTPVKRLFQTVAEAMTETAGVMVGMADVLAEPVKELVEGKERTDPKP
ncbi:MAG: hypothetical protein HFF11_04815 [Angelakisella sp.]|jgi:hypothetical protein|nr:hypothetical protein [Angelakisella sp.]